MACRVSTVALPTWGGEDHVIHAEKRFGDVGFFFEYIEPRGAQPSVFKRLDEFRFIDDGAARDIDQRALRSQGLDHLPVDQVMRGRAAGRDDHNIVDIPGHLGQVAVVAIRDIRLFVAAVIDHIAVEGLELFRDFPADPSHSQYADRLFLDGTGQWRAALAFPFAGAHPVVVVDQTPADGEHQHDRRIGHIVVQHIRRMGHYNAVLRRARRIDRVIADAEARNHFQVRERCHEFRFHAVMAVRGDRLDGGSLLLHKGLQVVDLCKFVNGETVCKLVQHTRRGVADKKQIPFHCRNPLQFQLGGPAAEVWLSASSRRCMLSLPSRYQMTIPAATIISAPEIVHRSGR